MRPVSIAIVLCAVGLPFGCDRAPAPKLVTPPPATRAAAATAPATQAAAAPIDVVFVINDRPFTFPAAKIVTQTKDGKLRVTLFSDDPPEAVRDGYTGNSFYFAFALDGDTADDLQGQAYVFQNSATEQEDTTNGLFIAGGRQTLRPMDASINFDTEDGRPVVYVGGSFKLIDAQTPDGPEPLVKLQGRLEPSAVTAKR